MPSDIKRLNIAAVGRDDGYYIKNKANSQLLVGGQKAMFSN
jgi:hypothetical protein